MSTRRCATTGNGVRWGAPCAERQNGLLRTLLLEMRLVRELQRGSARIHAARGLPVCRPIDAYEFDLHRLWERGRVYHAAPRTSNGDVQYQVEGFIIRLGVSTRVFIWDCTFLSWVSAASAEMGPQSRYLLAMDWASGRLYGCKWDGACQCGPNCVLTRGFSGVGRLVECLSGHDIPQVSSDRMRKRRSWHGAAPQSAQTAAGFALCQRQQRTTARGRPAAGVAFAVLWGWQTESPLTH